MTAILSTVTVATDRAHMTADDYAGNLTAVVSIGRRTIALAGDTDKVAAAIIESMGAEYNWTARGAKPAAVHLFVCGAAKGDAVPAQRDENKRPTLYGTGVDTLVHSITRALASDEPTDSPAVMRVALKGVGSAVVPTDHPAYPLLMALLGADADASEEGEEA